MIAKSDKVSLSKNSISSLLRWILPFAVSLVITPLLISHLGSVLYGVLTMVNSTVSLIGFFGVGFNDALIKHLSHELSVQDEKRASHLVQSNLFLFLSVAGIITILITVLSKWIAVSIISPEPQYILTTRWVVMLTGGSFAISLTAGALAAILAASQRYDILALITFIYTLCFALGRIVIVLVKPDIVLLVAWNLLVAVGNTVALWGIVRRYLPGLSLRPQLFRPALKQLMNFSVFRILDAILGLAFYQFDRILIGMLMGVDMVMYYSVPATLAQMFGHGPNSLTMPLIPKVSSLLAGNKILEIRNTYFKFSQMVAWIVLTGVAFILILAQPLLNVWLGNEFGLKSHVVLKWLASAWGVLAIGVVATNVAYGFGRTRVVAILRFFQTVGGLGGILLFTPRFGIEAAGWGLFVVNAATITFLLFYVEHLIQTSVGNTFRFCIVKPLLIAIPVAGIAKLCEPLISDLLRALMVGGCCVATSIFFATMLGVLTNDEYSKIINLLRLDSKRDQILKLVEKIKFT